MLTLLRSALSRTGSIRFFATEGRAIAPTTVFIRGFPTRLKEDNFEARRTVPKVFRQLYEVASQHAPVKELRGASKMGNVAWLEFMKASDAASFSAKYSESNPLTILTRTVHISPSEEKPLRTRFHEGCTELILRYTPAYISTEEAAELVKKVFPNAESIKTNVKTTAGSYGSFFIKFASTADAQSAWEAYPDNRIEFGEGFYPIVSCHAPPSTEIHVYNLPQSGDREVILNQLQQFGEVIKFNYEFEPGAPRMSGRAHVGFVTEEASAKLFAATMNEEVIIGGLPVRAENLWKQKPRDQDSSESASQSNRRYRTQ